MTNWNGLELPEAYFHDENVYIIHGDSAKVLSALPNNCIDLSVTSPPYDDLRKYNGFSFDWKTVAQELYRTHKSGGVVVWIVGDATLKGSETGTSFRQALHFKDIGFNLHDTMIYQKSTPPLTHNRYEQNFEYMFVFSKGKPNAFNGIRVPRKYKDNRTNKAFGKNKDDSIDKGYSTQRTEVLKTNVWQIFAGGGASDPLASSHPAPFPEQLANDHILSWSKNNDIVLDPLLGSGTTVKMAVKNSRKCIGVEISEEYCELATVRYLRSVNEQ
jgi:site-specific DNA-methyltransferase (adenine-specific)